MCTLTYLEDILAGMYDQELSLEWQELFYDMFWYYHKGGNA